MRRCWWFQGAVVCACACVRVRVCACGVKVSLGKHVTQIWLCQAESKEINYGRLNRGSSIHI